MLNSACPSKITEIGGFTAGHANLPNPAPWGFPLGHPGCAGFTLSGKALQSCFGLHLETQKGNLFLGEGKGSSREKPDHTAKPIWQFAITKALIAHPSSASLPLCPPVHPHMLLLTLALTTTLSRVIQFTGLGFAWDCKTREVGLSSLVVLSV